MTARKERLIECIILIVCFFLYTWWAAHLPQSMAPDEKMRMDVPFFIHENGFLPHGGDPSIRSSHYGFSYAFTVYGSSLIAVFFMKIAAVLGASDYESLLLAARLVDAALSTGTVFLCFRIGRRLFASSSTAHLLLGIFIGFLPQFAFVSAYFNSDALEVFSGTLIIYCWLRGAESQWSWRDCFLLGLGLGICSLSYYFAYGYILTSIVFYYATAFFFSKTERPRGSTRQTYLIKPLIILLAALTVAGWFFVRNILIYDGDIFGMKTTALYGRLYGADATQPENRSIPANLGENIFDMLFSRNWLRISSQSFIGVFGAMNISLPRILYYLYMTILVVGMALSAIFFIRQLHTIDSPKRALITCLLFALVIPLIISIYYSWGSDFQPQGRYLFAGLTPLMICVTWGYKKGACTLAQKASHLKMFRKSTIGQRANALLVGLAIIWIGLFAYSFFGTAIPQCTGPLL